MEITISSYKIMKRFPDERSARVYLEKQRWNKQPMCPFCNSDRIQIRYVEGLHRCLSCKKDFTVRTGTILERSHIPLNKWIFAMYLIVTARKGISSLQISKELGITQKSAWYILQRLRESCDNNHVLNGIVEADESYIGGKESNKHAHKKLKAGRGSIGKMTILGMREIHGMVKALPITNTKTATIHSNIRANISAGSTLCTDEHNSYRGMVEFNHLEVKHSAKEFVNGMAHTNGIESMWAVLKRGYYGTYHNFSTKHIQRYVNEFMFRLNEGSCNFSSIDRVNALFRGMIGKTMTYKELKT